MTKKYQKEFDLWNDDKKILHREDIILYPKEREIWNIKLWVNIGSEADGKRGFYRPALVLAKVWAMYLVVPMTTKGKIDSPYYLWLSSVQFDDGHGQPLISSLLLSHIRTIDKRRFFKHKGTISRDEFGKVQKILWEMYFRGWDIVSPAEAEWGARRHL